MPANCLSLQTAINGSVIDAKSDARRLIREHGGCDDDSMVTLPQDALLALLGEASDA